MSRIEDQPSTPTGEEAMRINMLGYGVAVLAALLVSACGTREPENISEDQLNHFTGITEHDHPSSPTADQQSGDSSAASNSVNGEAR